MNYPFENDTSAVIKKLARKSVRFDKKKNLFCLSAIIVAVAMIMMSLLTVQNIIYQNQKEIEGLHQGIFFDITQDSYCRRSQDRIIHACGFLYRQ